MTEKEVRYRDRNVTERVLPTKGPPPHRSPSRQLATNYLDAIHLTAAALVASPNANQPAHVVLPVSLLQRISTFMTEAWDMSSLMCG